MGQNQKETQRSIFEMIAYCIGNGPSRKNFDLTKLSKGATYGCNALYRDYIPTYLFCLDGEIADEWEENDIQTKCKVYTTMYEAKKRKGFNVIPNFEKLVCSGDQSIKTAYHDGCRQIFLIGYDFMEYGPKMLNNIYQGSRNYGVRLTEEEFSKSIKWFLKFVQEKEDCNFVIVHDTITEKIKQGTVDNLNIIPYKQFEEEHL